MAQSTLSGLARRTGASPGQLALLLASVALAAYAGFFLLGDPSLLRMLIWFAGAALVHDLVLFPAYSAADRALVAAARGHVPLINHIRVPAMGAGLTLLMFWPGIVRQGGATHLAATGLDQSPYLGHWLGLTAVLFGLSGLVYGARVAAARLRRWRCDHRAARAAQTTRIVETTRVAATGRAAEAPRAADGAQAVDAARIAEAARVAATGRAAEAPRAAEAGRTAEAARAAEAGPDGAVDAGDTT